MSATPADVTCAQVGVMIEGRTKPRNFVIKIKWVAEVNIMNLRNFVKCALPPMQVALQHLVAHA